MCTRTHTHTHTHAHWLRALVHGGVLFMDDYQNASIAHTHTHNFVNIITITYGNPTSVVPEYVRVCVCVCVCVCACVYHFDLF